MFAADVDSAGPDRAGDAGDVGDADVGEVAGRIAHGALRGAIAAMAMTGMREFTRRIGILEEPPPEAIVRQRLLPGPFRRAEHGRKRVAVELLHWSYGAGGGAAFAALPSELRNRPWAGPLYGVVVWGGFELAIAPLLDLDQAKRVRPLDRLALIADHLLYGFVLSETRRRPRD
jgi:hypothetical protein